MSFTTAEAALRALDRMARTSELKRLGVTEAELTRAVRSGAVVRPRQGVYALPETPEGLRHAASHGGTLGCSAAGELHGLWILETPSEHHIWLGRGGTPRNDCDECRVHWDGFARSDADSGLESIFRLRMHRLGIPVRSQVHIRTVGEVDFVIGDRLIIEADGRENHEREKERSKDLARDAAAAALGFETLRFTYAMIVHNWEIVESAVLAKVAEDAHLRPLH